VPVTITNGYTDLATLREELGNYISADTGDDAKLGRAIEAASRQIDGYCGRKFWVDSTEADRQFWAESGRLCYVDDISTVTNLAVKIDEDANGSFERTLTITTDFILLPANAADMVPVRPYTEIILADNYTFPMPSNGRPGVQVTAKFGWPAVPDDVKKACLIQAADLFKAKDAPFGMAGSDQMGQLRVTSSIHRFAQALLAPYRKPAVG
jgi:hypothetical protein